MKSKKKTQVTAYKQALKSISTYEKNLAAGKEIYSKTVEDFKKDISKFLNKKGTLSKRALRYNKAVKEFNDIVSEYRTKARSSAKNRMGIAKKAQQTAINNGTVADEKQYNRAVNMFSSNVVQHLIDTGAFDSDQIIDWSSDSEISDEDFLRFADYLKIQLEDVPDELKKYSDQDDITLAIEQFQRISYSGLDAENNLKLFDNDLTDMYEDLLDDGNTPDEIIEILKESGYM